MVYDTYVLYITHMPKPSRLSRRRLLVRPLDTLLASGSHIAVLRVLDPTAVGATGREIARLAGIDPHSALNALSLLEGSGLVRRRAAGRANLYALNRAHRLWKKGISPLLAAERAFSKEIREAIAARLRRHVVAAAIFGSAARGEEGPDSDLDLCLIVALAAQKEAALAAAAELSGEMADETGLHLSPIAFTIKEFKRMRRDGNALMTEIVDEAVTIVGRHPKAL